MSRLAACSCAILFLLAATAAQGQGVLINVEPDQSVRLPRPIIIWPPHPHPLPQPVPEPESTYKIKELAVNARIEGQVARVQVSQSFVNTGSRQMEVCFVFPLPYDGAVDQLTLMVDGKEFPAKLLAAKEARRMYEDIVRKNKDPALLEWMGTGMFKTSVFPVPAGAERNVTLRYSQLCRTYQGLTDFVFPLSTAKYTSHAVERVAIDVTIASDVDIKNVYSPSHSVEIKRPDNKHATVSVAKSNEVPTADFRLLYDVGKGALKSSVLSYRPDKDEDGYFLLLASPEIKADDDERPKKTVQFVVDRSGSMSGEKMEQAKGALKFVLNNLREGDLFNVIAYDSTVESWQPELQKFNDENRQKALGFVEGLYAGGSTNISGALTTALEQLKDESRPNFVIFLTDGIPTVGETNESKIVDSASDENDVRARIFAFGVGYDVNSRLLDRLVRENFGQSEYVRPNEDLEDRVSRFYNRIGSPVMSDLAIKFDLEGLTTADGEAVNRYYPKNAHDLFAGEQLVVVGRYKKSGDAKVTISGKVGDDRQEASFPAKFVEKSDDEAQSFVEKLWAVRRVGEIIDEIDLKGKNDELVKELVTLATKHGILTPYTSFLADENASRDLAENVEAADLQFRQLSETGGASGFAQRAAKGAYQRADRALNATETYDAFAAPEAAAGPGAFGQGQASRGRTVRAGGGQPSVTLGLSPGQSPVADADPGRTIQQSLRTVGPKTFYHRDKQWVDADVTKEQEAKPQRVERYSAEYFELVDRHGADSAKYLAFDEPVLVNLDGQAYLIE